MTAIKICGLTNLEDARCASEAGAELLGFIFYPKSARYVTAEQAAAIVSGLRKTLSCPLPRLVGVFVNEPVEGVRAIVERVGLDLAQLHGDEPFDQLQALGNGAYKAIRPATVMQARAQARVYASARRRDLGTPDLLIDAYHPQRYGGTGRTTDVSVARDLSRRYRLLLAGGLAPETVAEAILQVQPWGVDVSSGVERTKGKKDPARIRAFIQAVRSADRQLHRAVV
jgi:phosphoribosylanthranilate isomerase